MGVGVGMGMGGGPGRAREAAQPGTVQSSPASPVQSLVSRLPLGGPNWGGMKGGGRSQRCHAAIWAGTPSRPPSGPAMELLRQRAR